MTLVECSVDIIPINAHAKRQYVFLFFLLFFFFSLVSPLPQHKGKQCNEYWQCERYPRGRNCRR
jgi:hypothetical protein